MKPTSGEKGASALVIVAALVLLFGMAAIAVDLGAGFNGRRQNQTSADLAVLAGAIGYASPTAEEDARDAVLTYVRNNLATTYSNGAWQSLWTSCTDPGKPVGFNSVTAPAGWGVATLDCISGSDDELRVRIPDQLVETTFGKTLGVKAISVSAVAHASVRFGGAGGVRPFGILNGIGAGETCLTTSPSGLGAPPCDGPDSGNFGTLNSQTWGPPKSKTTIMDCGLPGNDELAGNIAGGIDHMIGLSRSFVGAGGPYGPFPAATTRLDNCSDATGEALAADSSPRIGPVNTLRADTGFNLFQATMAGLINGQAADFPNSTPAPDPLLQQTSASTHTRDLRERIGSNPYLYTLDNTHLAYHLRDMADILFDDSTVDMDVQLACDKATILASADWSDALNDCLAEYEDEGETVVLFEDTVNEGPRFGWVPQFHFTTWGSGNHWQPVKQYRMIYLDTFWFNCNGQYNPNKNDAPCDGAQGLVFEANSTNGDPVMQVGNGASMKQLRLDQISAFLLPPTSVSHKVAASFPGSVRGPFDIELTR